MVPRARPACPGSGKRGFCKRPRRQAYLLQWRLWAARLSCLASVILERGQLGMLSM